MYFITQMKQALSDHFSTSPTLAFSTLSAGQSRRAAAASLFEVLVLTTKGFIDTAQATPFGDITMTPTPALLSA